MERAKVQLWYIKKELKSRTTGLCWVPTTVGSCHPNWWLLPNSKRKEGGIIVAAFTSHAVGHSRPSNEYLRALTTLDNHWEPLTRRDLCNSCIWEVLVVSGISLWRRASSKRFIALWHRWLPWANRLKKGSMWVFLPLNFHLTTVFLIDPQSLRENKKKYASFSFQRPLYLGSE